MGLGYAFIKNYFDNTVKTPDDIENRNIKCTCLDFPQLEGIGQTKIRNLIYCLQKNQTQFRAKLTGHYGQEFNFQIRKDAIKSILVTSSTPQER